MNLSTYRPSIDTHTSAEDVVHVTPQRSSTMQPVINNFYVHDSRAQPFTIFPSPSPAMEQLALSQPRPPTASREMVQKRRREERQAPLRTAAPGDGVVNPYDKHHQGHVPPIPADEERSLLSESIESYRRRKLARMEPLAPHTERDAAPSEAQCTAELRRLQEQYHQLQRVVDETRAELQRSRDESERSKETSQRAVGDLRVELAQLGTHVQLLEGRQTALEQSVGAVRAIHPLMEAVRGDLSALRGELSQKSTAIAVLEKTVENLRPSPSIAAVNAGSGFQPPAIAPPTRTHATSAATETAKAPPAPFSFGGGGSGATPKSFGLGSEGEKAEAPREAMGAFSTIAEKPKEAPSAPPSASNNPFSMNPSASESAPRTTGFQAGLKRSADGDGAANTNTTSPFGAFGQSNAAMNSATAPATGNTNAPLTVGNGHTGSPFPTMGSTFSGSTSTANPHAAVIANPTNAPSNPFAASTGGGANPFASANSGGGSNPFAAAPTAGTASPFGASVPSANAGNPFGTGGLSFAQPMSNSMPFESAPTAGGVDMLGMNPRKKITKKY